MIRCVDNAYPLLTKNQPGLKYLITKFFSTTKSKNINIFSSMFMVVLKQKKQKNKKNKTSN